jgi:hypothetical protein
MNTPTPRGMIFSEKSVRAILDGRKTQTRRVIKPQPAKPWTLPQITNVRGHNFLRDGYTQIFRPTKTGRAMECPVGVGDEIWVRERFYIDNGDYLTGPLPKEKPINDPLWDDDAVYYRADGDCCDQIPECACAEVVKPKWRSPIFMPRWCSRITLRVVAIGVERLRDISHADAIAEGMNGLTVRDVGDELRVGPIDDFKVAWDKLNGKKFPWSTNPFVWVLEFTNIVRDAARAAERDR